MRIGVYVFGLASVAAGIMDLVWGEFEAAHQPIQALSDHIPGVKILAYIAAIWLIATGAAILWRSAARTGAVALAIIYFIFAAFLFPRFYTAPHFLGHHPGVYIGVLAGVGQQLILVVAAVIVYTSLGARDRLSGASLSLRAALIARWTFGLCSVDFGLAHLTGVHGVALMIPKWMPFGGDFWTIFTGTAFVLAGLAILSGILDVLAARLLALMLLVFSVFVLAPMIFAYPHNHIAWGGNAYNLAAVGAAWILADWLSTRRHPAQNLASPDNDLLRDPSS
jgi:uncharacterized membrane protein YphA (DoxX/SURF4 family)